MRGPFSLADQKADVWLKATRLIRTTCLVVSVLIVATASTVRPSSAKCLKWQFPPPTQGGPKCLAWSESGPKQTHLPSSESGNKKKPCNFGQKC
jgi:hypothetical protein